MIFLPHYMWVENNENSWRVKYAAVSLKYLMARLDETESRPRIFVKLN